MKRRALVIVFLVSLTYFGFAQLTPKAVRLGSGSEISNTIIYQNRFLYPVSPDIPVKYSALDTVHSGTGNIQLFSSPFVNGFRINSSTPAYNNGANSSLQIADTLDLDYAERIICEHVDMGAYEFAVIKTQIMAQPANVRTCDGTAVNLSVAADGTNVTYQWQHNGVNMIGKTASTLSLSGVMSDTGIYHVIAYGDCCNDTSVNVRVDVDLKPTLVIMPDTSVLSPANANLYVISAIGTVTWYETDLTTEVTETALQNITETQQYIAIAKNGVCPDSVQANVTIAVIGSECVLKTLPDTTICYGDSYLLLMDSALVNYQWVIAGTSDTLPKFSWYRPDSTVRLVAFGDNGVELIPEYCSDTLTITVRKLELTVMEDLVVCGAESGTEVQLISTPPADGWYFENGGFIGAGNVKLLIQKNSNQTYIAERSDELCKVQGRVTIYSDPPDLTVFPEDTTICMGQSIHLTSNIDSAKVVWKEKSTGSSVLHTLVTPTVSTIYEASVVDPLCGTVFAEVTVTVQSKPTFEIQTPPVVCKDSIVYLSASPNASWWTDADGIRITNGIAVNTAQTFIGWYRSDACTVSDTITLAVDSIPSFIACSDTSLTLGNSVMLWSIPLASTWIMLPNSPIGAGNTTVYPTDTAIYVANFFNACGVFSDTVNVYVRDTFFVTVTTDKGCFDGDGSAKVSVNGATGPYTFVWSTGSTDSVITGLTAGDYSVTVTDKTNQQVVTPFSIEMASPVEISHHIVEAKNETCNDGEITVSVSGGTLPYAYLWSDSVSDQNRYDMQAGVVYTLMVTDATGCADTSTILLPCLHKRIMPTLFITPDGDGKNDYLMIENIAYYPQNKVIILNAYGEEVAHLENYDNQEVKWDGRNKRNEILPDGVYYYVVEAVGVKPMAGWLLMKLSKSK